MQNSTPAFRVDALRLVSLPGASLDVVVDAAAPEQPVMAAYQAAMAPLSGTASEVLLRTSRGDLRGILTRGQGRPGAVLWLAGNGPGLNGPAGGVYADLAQGLKRHGISSLRIDYRNRQSFEECVLDALMGLALLKAGGIREVAVVGYQVGGSVAIAVAALAPWVKAVAGLASQTQSAGLVESVAPRPLLLIHGGKDAQVPPESSAELYQRAQEPKELLVYPDAGFRLLEVRDAVAQKLGGWLADLFEVGDAYYREDIAAETPDEMVRELAPSPGATPRRLVLTHRGLAEAEAEAIVSPTGTWLDLKNTPLARELLQRGGEEIQTQLYDLAPLFVGDVGVTGAGSLPARYIFHAMTGGMSEGEEMSIEQMVITATRNVLQAAEERSVRSVAFPALAAGNRGFPPEKVARLMMAQIVPHLVGPTVLEQVTLSMVTEGAFQSFADQFAALPERPGA